jgi:hypothetical protein
VKPFALEGKIMTTTTWAGTAGHYTGRAWRTLVWIESQIDWAEVGQIVWHGLIAFAVGVYLAGEFTGRWVHRANDRLARLWVRLWVPTVEARHAAVEAAVQTMEPTPAPVALLVMAQAAAMAPANVAPPARPTDPMERAIHLVRVERRSQRLAASLCGVSRSSLQRALKA